MSLSALGHDARNFHTPDRAERIARVLLVSKGYNKWQLHDAVPN